MSLLQLLKKINPNFKKFVIQEIFDEHGALVGTKCFGVEKDSNVFAGGTALEKEHAMRIAIAEAFERSFLQVIFNSPHLTAEFDLVNFPSSSGFAAGFDEASTRFRAICEGLERWIWSKWIDDGFFIPEEKIITSSFTPLTNHLLKSFDQTYWFKKNFTLSVSPTETLNLSIVIFLGCYKDGIFPGSRVSSSADDLYQHPVIEAHRNLLNALLNEKKPQIVQDIIQERTYFFGHNKDLALEQVGKANKNEWPVPGPHLLKKFETESQEIFLYRCLLTNFIGWHAGPLERFVY